MARPRRQVVFRARGPLLLALLPYLAPAAAVKVTLSLSGLVQDADPTAQLPGSVEDAEAFCLDVLDGPSLRQRFAAATTTPDLDEAVFRAAFGPLWASRITSDEYRGDEPDADTDTDTPARASIVRVDALQLLEGSRAAHRRLARQCGKRLASAHEASVAGTTAVGESRQVYTFLYEADYSEFAQTLLELESMHTTTRGAQQEERVSHLSSQQGRRTAEEAEQVDFAVRTAREQGQELRKYVNRLLVVAGAALEPEIVLEEDLSHKAVTEWKYSEKTAEAQAAAGLQQRAGTSVLDGNWLRWDWAPTPELRRKTFLWKTIVKKRWAVGHEPYRRKLAQWFASNVERDRTNGQPLGYAIVANVRERGLIEPWAPPYCVEYVESRSSRWRSSHPQSEAGAGADSFVGGEVGSVPFSDEVHVGLALNEHAGPQPVQGRWRAALQPPAGDHEEESEQRAWFFARADAEAVCRDFSTFLLSEDRSLELLKPSYALARPQFRDGTSMQRGLFLRDLPPRDRLLLFFLSAVRAAFLREVGEQQQRYHKVVFTRRSAPFRVDYKRMAARLARLNATDLFAGVEEAARQSSPSGRRLSNFFRLPDNLLAGPAHGTERPGEFFPVAVNALALTAATAVQQNICRERFGIPAGGGQIEGGSRSGFPRPAQLVPPPSLYAPGSPRHKLLSAAGGDHSGLVAAHPAVVRTMRRYFASRLTVMQEHGALAGRAGKEDCVGQVLAEAKLFGSAVSGFGTRHSDLDVSFALPQQLLDSSSACVLESLPEGEKWSREDWARVIYKSRLGDATLDKEPLEDAGAGYFRPQSWRDTYLARLGKTIGTTPSTELRVRSVAELTSRFWPKFWLLENVVKRLFETDNGVIAASGESDADAREQVWMSWLSCEIEYDERNGHVIGKAQVAVRKSLLDLGSDAADHGYYRADDFVFFNVDLVVARFDDIAQTKLSALQSLALADPAIRDAARLFLRFAKKEGISGTLSPKTEFSVMPSFRFLLVFVEFLIERQYVHCDSPLSLHPRFLESRLIRRLTRTKLTNRLLADFVSYFVSTIAAARSGSAVPDLTREGPRERMAGCNGSLRDKLFAVRKNAPVPVTQPRRWGHPFANSYLAHNPWEMGREGEPEYLRPPVLTTYDTALWTRDFWLWRADGATSQALQSQNPYRFMNPMPRLEPALRGFLAQELRMREANARNLDQAAPNAGALPLPQSRAEELRSEQLIWRPLVGEKPDAQLPLLQRSISLSAAGAEPGMPPMGLLSAPMPMRNWTRTPLPAQTPPPGPHAPLCRSPLQDDTQPVVSDLIAAPMPQRGVPWLQNNFGAGSWSCQSPPPGMSPRARTPGSEQMRETSGHLQVEKSAPSPAFTAISTAYCPSDADRATTPESTSSRSCFGPGGSRCATPDINASWSDRRLHDQRAFPSSRESTPVPPGEVITGRGSSTSLSRDSRLPAPALSPSSAGAAAAVPAGAEAETASSPAGPVPVGPVHVYDYPGKPAYFQLPGRGPTSTPLAPITEAPGSSQPVTSSNDAGIIDPGLTGTPQVEDAGSPASSSTVPFASVVGNLDPAAGDIVAAAAMDVDAENVVPEAGRAGPAEAVDDEQRSSPGPVAVDEDAGLVTAEPAPEVVAPVQPYTATWAERFGAVASELGTIFSYDLPQAVLRPFQ